MEVSFIWLIKKSHKKIRGEQVTDAGRSNDDDDDDDDNKLIYIAPYPTIKGRLKVLYKKKTHIADNEVSKVLVSVELSFSARAKHGVYMINKHNQPTSRHLWRQLMTTTQVWGHNSTNAQEITAHNNHTFPQIIFRH